MDYQRISGKKEQLSSVWDSLPKEAVASFNQSFAIEYAHNSTAIEGNTLTLLQTKAVLEDGLSVGGKTLREIYEVVNHNKAFEYVKDCVAKKKPLDEHIVKDIHALLMENILTGGIYRNVEVRISGAGHKPPAPSEMYQQIKFSLPIFLKNPPSSIHRTGCLDSCRVCENPSFCGREWTNFPDDHELSAYEHWISASLHCKRKSPGLFRSTGSLCSSGRSFAPFRIWWHS